jgi:cytochrome c
MKNGIVTFGIAALALTAAGCGSGSPSADPAAEAPAANEAATAPVPDLAAAPPAFAQCRTCHAVEPGRSGAGPSLHGIVGAQAASVAGFPYSKALKDAGLVWDRATLDRWLAAPVKMVPGTRMVTMVPDEAQRAQIIDYLETLK